MVSVIAFVSLVSSFHVLVLLRTDTIYVGNTVVTIFYLFGGILTKGIRTWTCIHRTSCLPTTLPLFTTAVAVAVAVPVTVGSNWETTLPTQFWLRQLRL